MSGPTHMASSDRPERLWRNARLATLAPDREGLGLVDHGALAARGGRILFAGAEADLPAAWRDAAETIDCAGRWITPGLIDCHTHLVYAGSRAREFERRLAGASYAEIAAEGGGILSTVAATRAADEEALLRESLPRLDALLAEGVTTVEIKSGYGLDLATERRQLRVARRLGRERPVTVATTFLGLHALPPEAARDRAGYVARLVEAVLPAIAEEGLADAVDAFCESIAFTPDEVARLFVAAQRLGLRVKLHADQLSDHGGAALAASFGALSADHLEYVNGSGIAAMARAGTVAVMLPGACYFLREPTMPPVARMREHGVRLAVATDCNPGTSPLTSLLLAATLFRMTVAECLAGITREAARALGMLDAVGTLEPGKRCDLAIWDVGSLAELVYRIGFNPLHARVRGGA